MSSSTNFKKDIIVWCRSDVDINSYYDPLPQYLPDITENIYHKVYKLNCSSIYIDDLSFIKKFINLEILVAPYNKIYDISVLENMEKLRYIDLSHNYIDYVRKLPKNLETLDISYNELKNIDNFKKSYKLVELNCSNNKIMSLSGLKYLPLYSLDCSYNLLSKNEDVVYLMSIEKVISYGNKFDCELLTSHNRRTNSCCIII